MKNSLTITQEFILMILNNHTGYFYQVRGWDLNCAVIGSVLAELAIKSRIDTDADSLYIIDASKTGNPNLDLCLEALSKDNKQRSTRYWVERLAIHSEAIIDHCLDRLVEMNLLKHHAGDFYSMTETCPHAQDGSAVENNSINSIRNRIHQVIFTDEIPDPKDIFIISMLNVCDVIRFIFDLDEATEERVQQICQLELISRTISDAVMQSIISPALKRSPATKKIPSFKFASLMTNKYFWQGHIPALIADIVKKHGPVFRIKIPFRKPLTFIAGDRMNQWVHRNARKVMGSGAYFRQLEQACGASGLITSLDGADHFRLRKVMSSVYSESKFFERIDDFCNLTIRFMAEWNWRRDFELSVQNDTRLLINSQMTNIIVSTDSQDVFSELVKWKERASNAYVGNILPKWMMKTPRMKRRFNTLVDFVRRIEQNHTPHQRSAQRRELADELISLHNSDPQFMPEQNLPFLLGAAPILQSIYLGDTLGFALYELAKHPEIAQRIREEAAALFDHGIPAKEDLTEDATDTTRRFVLEILRMYPVVPLQVRTVSNTFVFEDYTLPVSEQVYLVQTAAHYTEENFPDPHKLDIDRYLPDRAEDRSHGYAPYGLGTHMCVGYNWMRLQLVITLLTISRHFSFAPPPKNDKLQINPFPTLSVSKKMKLKIADQHCELPG